MLPFSPMNRVWRRSFLSFTFLFTASVAFAKRAYIDIKEFEWRGEYYNRIVIRIDPNEPANWQNLLTSIQDLHYAEHILNQLQERVRQAYLKRGRSEDGSRTETDLAVFDAVLRHPDPFPKDDNNYDEPGPRRWRETRVDDYLSRPTAVIAIFKRNDLSKLIATVKFVETDFVRQYSSEFRSHLFRWDSPFQDHVENLAKVYQQRNIDIENLVVNSGKEDWFAYLFQVTQELNLLQRSEPLPPPPPNLNPRWDYGLTTLHLAADSTMQAEYSAMGFNPYFQTDVQIRMRMKLADLDGNLKRFFSGQINHEDSMGEENLRRARIMMRARSRQVPVKITEYRPVPYRESFSQEHKSEKWPHFLKIRGPLPSSSCESPISQAVPFY
jgi:hypothetical protein